MFEFFFILFNYELYSKVLKYEWQVWVLRRIEPQPRQSYRLLPRKRVSAALDQIKKEEEENEAHEGQLYDVGIAD